MATKQNIAKIILKKIIKENKIVNEINGKNNKK